ncbi:probable transmembrane protein 106B at N-terminal half [Coccomyxa sp. Obi]|nr:probable transmembrane protein 106B at N-terminal half [Coccomyxa sp. Obi]
MSKYVRLSHEISLPDGSLPEFSPPFATEYELNPTTKWGKFKQWWRVRIMGEPAEPVPPSGYMTLIPLNDARLKPQRKLLFFSCMMLFVVAAMAATFLLVPRGFSAGEIDIQSDHMSWNTTKGTYQLNLLARIPINNPNFLNAKVEGNLKVYFYDTEAGSRDVEATIIPARTFPMVLEVTVDASNVPGEYALTILSECAAFPRRLVFFLKGSLWVRDFFQKVDLAPIDTYFMIDCVNGGKVPGPPVDPSDLGAPLPTAAGAALPAAPQTQPPA